MTMYLDLSKKDAFERFTQKYKNILEEDGDYIDLLEIVKEFNKEEELK